MKELMDLGELSDQEKAKLISELRAQLRENEQRNKKLEDLLKVHRLWLKHKGKLFPAGCGGKIIQGIDLVSLDSYTAGCASVFLERGTLDSKRTEILCKCRKDLGIVNRALSGYEGFYYRQLEKLASAVLKFIEVYGSSATESKTQREGS